MQTSLKDSSRRYEGLFLRGYKQQTIGQVRDEDGDENILKNDLCGIDRILNLELYFQWYYIFKSPFAASTFNEYL